MADLSSGTPPAATPSIHREYLERTSPPWLVGATSSRREQLKAAPVQPPDWFQRASADQQKTLTDKFTAAFTTQTALDKAMAPVQDIDTFAEPLLVKALMEQHQVQLDVHKTLVVLRKTLEIGAFGLTAGSFEVLRMPLLQAALHNFEAAECSSGAFDKSSGFFTKNPAGDNIEAVSTALTVTQFTSLCRQLDIGAQYQRYLEGYLRPKDAVAEQALRHKFITARKADLAAAAEVALLTKDIEPRDYRMILSVINGETEPKTGDETVWFRDLGLVKKRLVGCVAFVICEKYRYPTAVILYVPHDPFHPLKRFTFPEMKATFKQRFTARDQPDPGDGSPTAYQRFFSQFVAYGDLPTYFDVLTQDSPTPNFGTKLLAYAPLLNQFAKGVNPFSMFFGVKEFPPVRPAAKVPEPDPYMEPVPLMPRGRGLWDDNVDVWDHLYERHRDKILGDARSHAVPSADVDARVRSEKIAALLNIGLLVLTTVFMFVPVLGEVMMAVMASQLLLETIIGSLEWYVDDRRAAKAHLVDVAENLAFIAVMAGLGKAFLAPKTLTLEPAIEDLKLVTLDSGEEKLWRPDLAPYQAPITLPADARPNELGLYHHEGQTVLPLDGENYQLRHDPLNDEYRIQHPTRPQAYAPRLTHNLEGGWQHEAENPLSWDASTLIGRLGLPAEGMSTARVEAALAASDIELDTLRAEALDNNPIPLVLADTLQRFRGADEVAAFISQIKAPDPAVYAKADPALQMDLLQRRGMLGDARLRLLDAGANTLWDDAAPSSVPRRLVVLSVQAKRRGELLQQVLYTLQGVDPDLAEFPGLPSDPLPERAKLLRQDLGDYAQTHRNALVEERYRKHNLSNDPDVNRLVSRYPNLPTPMAEHLLRSLTDEQLQAFRTGNRLPDAVKTQAQWQAQEMRVSRAYEGLHVDALANQDSRILALRTLETLPGWRRGTRVEMREYSATGTVQDAIGSPDATLQKQLVLREDGQFEGSPPGDLYSALWQQLSAEECQALGATDAAHLQALIQRSPLPRGPMRTVLLEHPLQKPAYDPSMRLLGGAFSVRKMLSRAFSKPAERVRKLFPEFTEAQVQEFLATHGDNASRELTRLEKEFKKLEQDLATWVNEPPRLTTTLFERRGGVRKVYADAIVACWRRQTQALKIAPGTRMNLPELSADFSHVESLHLFNISWTTGAQNFLNRFKQLKVLTIRNAALTELPEGLDAMPNLSVLALDGNRIRLTSASVEQLGKLAGLEELNLQGSPLQLPPDLSRMPRLKKVDLSFTGLEQWPSGLAEQTNLEAVNLSHNSLKRIPPEHVNPAPEHFEKMIKINHAIDLRSNPFSAQSWLELDSYWQRVSQSHPDLAGLRDSDGFALESAETRQVQDVYPTYSLGRARQFWLDLGENPQAQMNQRTAVHDRLKQQLDAWAATGGGGGRQRYIRMRDMSFVGEDAGADRFQARQKILECWRRNDPQKLSYDGAPIGWELNLANLQLQSLPALDADFSHVGSLVLSNMGLSVSPEEFLSHFRGVRWLDMSRNRLHDLPPALGEMQGLTRLTLSYNQLRLTPDTARILSERSTLRLLAIDNNPLGNYPDFSQLRDLRTLSMSSTGIDHWPTGLGDQPELGQVVLDNNQLTTLPDRAFPPLQAPLPGAQPMSRVVSLRENPLTDATRQRVADYHTQAQLAGLQGHSRRFLLSAPQQVFAPIGQPGAGAHFSRWTEGVTPEQQAERQAQWQRLRGLPSSDGFFTMLNDMGAPAGGHADLQRRVWEVVDSMTEHSVESEALRDEIFEWAGSRACCDRAALSFSNVEIMTMVYRAKASATDVSQGPVLLKLARGLFRLDEVEKTALQDIAQRTEEINNDASLSADDKQVRIHMLEEVEVRLAYRYGLKDADKLDLPGQPGRAVFIGLGNVTQLQLDKTLARIRALDGSPQEFAALLTRDFWKDFVVSKYRPQFEELSEPYYEELAKWVDASKVENGMPEGELLAKSNDVKQRLAVAEEALIESLSRTEWEGFTTASK